MKKYQEVRNEAAAKRDVLFRECGLFWAFSDKQFEENKTPLQDGEKYISIGSGGYMPKSKVKMFTEGMAEIRKWESKTIKATKTKEEHIKYELANHECYYTGDISDACAVLPYSREDVLKVYQENVKFNQY